MKIFVKKCGDHLRMIPKKLAPASIGGGFRFSEKDHAPPKAGTGWLFEESHPP